jgi:hypothetical protein
MQHFWVTWYSMVVKGELCSSSSGVVDGSGMGGGDMLSVMGLLVPLFAIRGVALGCILGYSRPLVLSGFGCVAKDVPKLHHWW